MSYDNKRDTFDSPLHREQKEAFDHVEESKEPINEGMHQVRDVRLTLPGPTGYLLTLAGYPLRGVERERNPTMVSHVTSHVCGRLHRISLFMRERVRWIPLLWYSIHAIFPKYVWIRHRGVKGIPYSVPLYSVSRAGLVGLNTDGRWTNGWRSTCRCYLRSLRPTNGNVLRRLVDHCGHCRLRNWKHHRTVHRRAFYLGLRNHTHESCGPSLCHGDRTSPMAWTMCW